MMTPQLALSAALSLLMAVVYLAVGRVVRRRVVSSPAELAKRSFAAWWFILAGVTAAGVSTPVLSAFDLWTVEGLVVYTQIVIVLIVGALAALLYYFAYLFTGKRGIWKPIAVFHALYLVALLYYIAAADPIGIEHGTYGAQLEYANDFSGTPLAAAVGILLLLPTLIGAIGYMSLFRRVPDRSARFRMLTIALAFIIWFGSSLIAGQVLDVTGEDWWRLVSTAISLLASAMVYIGFQPPAILRKRFQLEGYDAPRETA